MSKIIYPTRSCFTTSDSKKQGKTTKLMKQLVLFFVFSLMMINVSAQAQLTIDNVADLQTFRDGINTGAAFTYKGNSVPAFGEGIHFKLTADLDLSSVCGENVDNWIPIGTFVDWTSDKPFKGHFHGGCHSISNLYINAPTSDYQGLFGYVNSGSIDSLNLINTNVTGHYNVGNVCGRNDNNSTISYCTNSGSVSGADYCTGGVCGENRNSSIISHCTNSGSVSGKARVGGVCGYNNDNSTISHCTNSGSVSGTGNFVGGVCGYNNDNSTFSHCTNSGSVSGYSRVGGVCGYNYYNSTISYCTNSGSVNGNDYVGGMCGYNDQNSIISYCTNSGSSSGGSYVGGMCGRNDAMISKCYYDKQMCTFGGIGSESNSSDVAGEAEGKLTNEMTRTALQDSLGTDDWTFADGLYPRVKNGTENSNAAIVAAMPIFLATINTNVYETVNNIANNFSYSGADTIAWSSAQSHISFSNGNATISSTGNDTIIATYGNANKSIAVKILKSISASISGLDAICKGSELTLTANSDAISPAYQWYENGNILTDNTSQTITIAPTTTSVYKVIITETQNNDGRWSEAEKTVTVNNSNTGDTTAVACDSFTWYGIEYTETPAIAPTQTFTNAAGCDSTVTLNLTINPLPVITISGDTTIEQNENTTLTASGANSYLWNTEETTPSIVAAPQSTTQYSVIGTDTNGCEGSAQVEVTVLVGIEDFETSNNTSLQIFPSPASSQITLQATDNTSITNVEIYDVFGKLIMSDIETNTVSQSRTINVSSLSSGTYFVRVTFNENNTVTKKLTIAR